MRTDKHKLLTVAYTDTVATCATAHVLIWRCRESLVGVIPYFLSYLTQRARETKTPWRPATPPAGPSQRRPSPRRRASSRVRRWSPPPGQASTPQSCRTTAGQNETRLAAPPPLPWRAVGWHCKGKIRGKNSARGRTRTHSCKKGVSGVLCGCVCWTVYLFAARLNRGAGLWHARHKLCARAPNRQCPNDKPPSGWAPR